MKKNVIILVTFVFIGLALSSCATKKCPAYAKNSTAEIESRV